MSGGGDSGGGGGGSSGAVSYPAYMQAQHETWLAALAADILAAHADSPYTGVSAYDPDDWLNAMLAALDSFAGVIAEMCTDYLDITALKDAVHGYELQVEGLNVGTSWGTFVDIAQAQLETTSISEVEILADVSAFSAILTNDVDSKSVARFESGMQNINAVMSSAFVIGKALIYSERDAQIAKYTADIRLKAWELNNAWKEHRNQVSFQAATGMLDGHLKGIDGYRQLALITADIYIKGVEFKRALTTMTLEMLRVGIVAKKEEADENLRIDVADAKWPLELYQHGANLLAGIGGGTHTTEGGRKPSTSSSVLGGAMSGAAMGAMVMPANPMMGAGIGAILGGAAGAFL